MSLYPQISSRERVSVLKGEAIMRQLSNLNGSLPHLTLAITYATSLRLKAMDQTFQSLLEEIFLKLRSERKASCVNKLWIKRKPEKANHL